MTTPNIVALYSPMVLIALIMFAFTAAPEAKAAEPCLRIVPNTSIRDASSLRITKAVDGRVSVSGATLKDAALPRRLVILFHGIRGRGSIMEAIGDSWQTTLPDTAFAAPDAPFTHKSGGRQWFALDEQVLRPDRIQAARRAFDGLVSDIIRREGFNDALDRVAFVGVYQGAIMALDAVATGRWRVGALVSFAGLLPLPPTSSTTETPILLIHGDADRTIPSAASVAAKEQLQSACYNVTLKTYPDLGHTISCEEVREAVSFLRNSWTNMDF